jgi:hypothetical protein
MTEWQDESRELALTCDAGGSILWADARVKRIVGAGPGDALLAMNGSGDAPTGTGAADV